MKKTQTYTKINTLYCRYKNLNKIELPNPKWKVFQNKIILGKYSDDFMGYIKDLKFDCFEKIDGTNSKIVFYPSTGECFCGGKTDNADIIGTGQKPFLDEIIVRIKPILAELFPPESAKFTPVINDKRQIQYEEYYWNESDEFTTEVVTPVTIGKYIVELEEVPIYIYGEFFGKKIQKGGNYDKDNNRFYVFDICQQGWYIPVEMLYEYVTKLGLENVPYVGCMTIDEAEDLVRKGFKTTIPCPSNPDYTAEGVVARPVIPIKDPRGNRIIVKIKNEDYADLQRAIEQVGEDEYIKFSNWYKENEEIIENS